MNYYKARRKQQDDRFHYTCQRDGQVWPVGYCSPDETCPECGGSAALMLESNCLTCGGRGTVRRPDPCRGHDTAAEAEQHMREFVIDNAARFGYEESDLVTAWSSQPCKVCGEATRGGYRVGVGEPEYIFLCRQHRNREGMLQTVKIGEVWST